MSILAINAGSSSVKFGLFDVGATESLLRGEIDWANGDRTQARLSLLIPGKEPTKSMVAVPDDFTAAKVAIDAVLGSGLAGDGIAVAGHRIVHGGAEFCQSVRLDARVKEGIARLGRLAPLHNPPALKTIEATEQLLPGVPQVAVFDTSFFAQLPPRAFLYALPYEYYTRWGIRRFGFHGLSHAYCAERATQMLGRSAEKLRLIICHLGSGCSAAAVRDGVPVASTLGYSPLEGLMMASRPGSVDPGILIHLQREHNVSIEELDRAMNYSSGLLGISGISPDFAQIEAAAAKGNARARLAFDMFADRVRSAIGSLAATMGGVDAVVFTDRVGENSALRAAACEGLEFMGLQLDPERNVTAKPDTDVAAPGSPGRILVIRTREELMVAREARRVALLKD